MSTLICAIIYLVTPMITVAIFMGVIFSMVVMGMKMVSIFRRLF
jgi:hypothetical protein